MRADNSIHLVSVWQRHEHTRAKAIAAMHELDRAGAALTFEAIARHAGVSRSWICTQTDLTDEVRRLRDQRRTQPSTPTPTRSAPATTLCGCVSKSPTTAIVNSPRRTSDYAVSWPAPSANAATTTDTGPSTSRKRIPIR